MEKTYWKGIEELEQSAGFVSQLEKEFADEVPALASITEPISTTKTNRRDFLKMLGFSVTAAAIATACEMPIRKSIPYALKPEEVTPGVANYYASTMFQGGDLASVLVKTREGRPIKVDANNLSSLSGRGTSARTQASVLSLYDGGRYVGPLKGKEKLTWEKADAEIGAKFSAIKSAGGKLAILSATIPSPSTQAAIDAFKATFNADHLVYDAISYSGILEANEQSFGVRTIPAYNFDKASVIVGIGCDFLGTWVSPEEFAGAWAKNRKVSKENATMSRHIQIESNLSMTGANADTRIAVKPFEENTTVVELLNAINGGSTSNPKLAKVATELKANAGKSLVVSGSNDTNVQLVVNAINQALGNYGTTISFTNAYKTKQGSDKSVVTLIEGLNSGAYKGVVFYETNPLHTSPQADKLAQAIKKAEVSVSFSTKADETSSVCSFVCPDSHWLESWNDFSPKVGLYNICQPTISKLFDTRQAQSSLLKWAGQSADYYSFVKNTAEKFAYPNQSKTSGFEGFWDIAVHDGEVVLSSGAEASFKGGTESAASAVTSTYAKGGDVQVKLHESYAVGNGAWADNPFLQELPDPITKVCWDNYLSVPVSWAKKNGIKNDLELKDYTIVEVTANGKTIKLPAVAVPGQAEGAFGIAVGYGKTVVTTMN
jgi:MoCo/4Fe-4S cofactor protein with predicted Tat translocation signal